MTSRHIIRRVRGQPASDGAGVKLTRILGQPGLDMLDPFLLLDEFRSDQPGDYLAGFPEHPHRGFETVTYMLAGHMQHQDNQGNRGDLGPGSVQWMTAGRGILHSEMPQQENGLMWGFQLWVNLPAQAKMTAPRYQDLAPERIPEVSPQLGMTVKVIAGRLGEVLGPIEGGPTEPVYLDVRLAGQAQGHLPLPMGHQAFVYVYEGALNIEGTVVSRGELGMLSAGEGLTVTAQPESARFLLIAGRPLREPVARYGPFVMNTREEIIEAVQDLQSGRFGNEPASR